MPDNKRRHPRIELNEPASVATEYDVFDGMVVDLSESGAAVEFVFGSDKSKTAFDIGSSVEVESAHVDKRWGRVVRHYDKGFAVNFDDDLGDR